MASDILISYADPDDVMTDYHFEGDPAIDSTRRHLERVLKEPQSRRWPWLVAVLAGGTAWTFWRIRSRPQKQPHAGTSRTPPGLTSR